MSKQLCADTVKEYADKLLEVYRENNTECVRTDEELRPQMIEEAVRGLKDFAIRWRDATDLLDKYPKKEAKKIWKLFWKEERLQHDNVLEGKIDQISIFFKVLADYDDSRASHV